MSVSNKSGAAHVRPVGDDFKVPAEQIEAPEAKTVTEPAAEEQAAPQVAAAAETPAPKRRKLVFSHYRNRCARRWRLVRLRLVDQWPLHDLHR